MSTPAPVAGSLRKCSPGLALGTVLALATIGLLPNEVSGQSSGIVTVEQVKDLQARYAKERAAAASEGLTRKFAPQWYTRADALAKKGEAALATGRLLEAREALRRARWLLPSLPAELPANVARVFGDGKLRHSSWVLALAYSPDGSKLASASRDGTVKVWDAQTGRELRTYTGHGKSVRAVVFRPDGKHLASAGEDKNIRLWEADSGKEVRTFTGHTETITSLAFSPDGQRLVSGGFDKNVHLHEVDTGKELYNAAGHTATITGLGYSPDGNWFASVSDSDRSVRVWKATAAVPFPQTSFLVPTGNIRAVSFTPDSKQLALATDNTIRLYDYLTNIERMKFEGHTAPIICLAFSKDGKILVSGSDDRSVRLWDMAVGLNIRTFQGHSESPVRAVAFHPDGTALVSGGLDQIIRLWEVGGGEQTRDFAGHEGAVWSALFSPEGKSLVSAGADRTVRLWEAETGKVLHILKGHTAPVTAALFSPDGRKVLSCGGDKVMKLWDASSGKELRTYKGHEGVITAAAFDAAGKRLVSGGSDRLVKVWDVETAKELFTFKGHTAIISTVAFHPEGQMVASASADQTIRLWPLRDEGRGTRDEGEKSLAPRLSPLTPPPSILTGHTGAIGAIAFSPDGKRLASCAGDQLVKVWTLGAEPSSLTLAGHNGPISSVAWSADGRFLVSGGADQLVKMWDVQGRQPQEAQTFRGHKDWVTSVAFSPDGAYLVSTSVDRTIRLWELVNREALPGAGHSREVLAVALSSDGKTIASGSGDRSVRLWDLATGGELGTPLLGHGDKVTALAYAPDGKRLVSAGGTEDRTLRIWDTGAHKELRTIREPGPGNDVPQLIVTPDGKQVMAWVVNNLVEVYDLATGSRVSSRPATTETITCLSFSADAQLAALGGAEGRARIVNLAKLEGLPGGEFPGQQEELADLAFTPDKMILITADRKGQIKIWDLAKGSGIKTVPPPSAAKAGAAEQERTIEGHRLGIAALAMSASGKYFATTGLDNVVKVWETGTGKEVRQWDFSRLSAAGQPLVRNLAFTPDGKGLVTANANSTLYLLEVP